MEISKWIFWTISLCLLIFVDSCGEETEKETNLAICAFQASSFQSLGRCYKSECGYGYCPNSECENDHSIITVSGQEILDCGEIDFVAPSTMTITFDYYADASTCYSEPYFIIKIKEEDANFTLPTCTNSGSAFLSVAIPLGATANDLSFTLYSGDWGSTVKITSITFE